MSALEERRVHEMNDTRETLLLKAVAADLLEIIWKTEFYIDAEDYILYKDPDKKLSHRSDEEIKRINSELSRVKNDLIDEIVEIMLEQRIKTFENVAENYDIIREICHKQFGIYRRRFWNVVKS